MKYVVLIKKHSSLMFIILLTPLYSNLKKTKIKRNMQRESFFFYQKMYEMYLYFFNLDGFSYSAFLNNLNNYSRYWYKKTTKKHCLNYLWQSKLLIKENTRKIKQKVAKCLDRLFLRKSIGFITKGQSPSSIRHNCNFWRDKLVKNKIP